MDDREKRIRSEKLRISKITRHIPENAQKSSAGLVDRLAYQRVALEDLEVDLLLNGYTEPFSQSPNLEPYERERPAARIYLNMTARYVQTVRQLCNLLPDLRQDAGAADELMEFIKRNQRHTSN